MKVIIIGSANSISPLGTKRLRDHRPVERGSAGSLF